jgi:nucleoside triphosphate diphosphatase
VNDTEAALLEVKRPAEMPAGLEGLLWLMARLRAPDGCKWDQAQTHESLRPYCIEEAHEVVDAIDRGDWQHLREELGDLLFQVVFHTQLTGERGLYGFDDVVETVTEKMLRRHPHVFGDRSVATPEEALATWNEMKRREKAAAKAEAAARGDVVSAIAGIPSSLPALIRAQRVGEKAAGAGMDWPDVAGPLEKIAEETTELREVVEAAGPLDKARAKEELGDLLFAIVNVARKLDIDAETALTDATNKFSRRFQACEKLAADRGVTMSPDDIATLNALWAAAKQYRD